MSSLASLLLLSAITITPPTPKTYLLTDPLPPDPPLQPNLSLPDSEDLDSGVPSEIAMQPAEIRHRLHRLGFKPVTDIQFARGRWQVIAYRQGEKRWLQLDENTGLLLSDRPARY